MAETGKAETEGRFASLPKLVPSYFGMFLLIAFETLLSVNAHSADPRYALAGYAAQHLVPVLALVSFAFVSQASFTLSSRPQLALWASALCVGGGILLATWRSLGLPETCLIAGWTLAGLGTTVLQLSWIEFYARLGMIRVVLHYAMAQILASLTIVVFSLLSPKWFVTTIYLTFPLLALLLYRRSLRIHANEEGLRGEEIRSGWSFPVKPVVLVGMFAFANTLVRSYLPMDARGYAALGVSLALIPMFLFVFFRPNFFDVRTLYRISFPLVIVGPLSLIIGGNTFRAIGALSTNAAYAYFGLFMAVVLFNISFRHGANAIWLFGFAFGSIHAGKLLARAAQAFLVSVADSQTVFFCTIVLVLSIMFAVLVTDKAFDGTWGVVQRRDNQAPSAALDDVVNRCGHLARVRGLTRREEEILFLLTQDFSSATIAGRLSLAESTVKTHQKHIYAKLGVHSKPELIGLIGRP